MENQEKMVSMVHTVLWEEKDLKENLVYQDESVCQDSQDCKEQWDQKESLEKPEYQPQMV